MPVIYYNQSRDKEVKANKINKNLTEKESNFWFYR